jgi:hypothetical protein
MLNVFEVADTLVEHIKSNFPEEIAIIGYYGSYAQGTATERSDLDFFFIPASSDGYRHSVQFIVDNICFDFWPISWERAERMAAFEELNVSIIADCKLLYVRSDEDRNRFMKLREQIAAAPSQGLAFLHKAEDQLKDACVHLSNMTRVHIEDRLTQFRHEAREILVCVLNSVSLTNRTYFTKGWGKNTEQMREFVHKPDQLEELMQTIMQSGSCTEIVDSCKELIQNTLRLLTQLKEFYVDGLNYSDRMKGFYEEIKGIFDKVLTACERNDYTTAYFWGIGVQAEIARALYFSEKGYWPISIDSDLEYMEVYKELGFPDLAALLDPTDLQPLFEAVERLDTLLEEHLRQHGVAINRFRDVMEFKRYLIRRSHD